MKESHVLEARERSLTGKGGSRKIRAQGWCPAVIYGPDLEARALQIEPRALLKLLHSAGENALIDLKVSGEGSAEPETLKVIVREMAYSPMGSSPEHVDFYKVSLDRSITVAVSVALQGTCEAVENKTGTVSQLVHELTIECLPADIPDSLPVDISSMTLGHSLHVRDIPVPAGITVLEDSDLAIATLTPVKEVEEKEEVAPELESAEPELVKGQKEEGEESGE